MFLWSESSDEYGNSLEDRDLMYEKNPIIYKELYRPFLNEKEQAND